MTTAGRSQTNITLAVDYWDFLYNNTPPGTYGGYAGTPHPDFQNYNGTVAHGLVQSILTAGLPIWKDNFGDSTFQSLTGPTQFSQWYQTTPGVNAYVPGVITLTNVGGNLFQFSSTEFFPLDGQGFNSAGYQVDRSCNPSDPVLHNFCFTTHIQYSMLLTDNTQSLSVTGQDDIWVFVNGKLAIDLGGIHGAISGSWIASPPNLSIMGLFLGETVSVDIFQANRHTSCSDFSLTINSANITPGLQPAVTITNAGPQVQLAFAGILQQSTDLIHWQDVNPQPSSPWTFTPTNTLFFQARR